MRQGLKYSNEIDWEYNIVKKVSTPRLKKMPNIKLNNNLRIDIDYSGVKKEYVGNSINKTKTRIKQPLRSVGTRSINGIYYGLLFVFIFGFLFFLTVSIGFAAPIEPDEYNEDNIYNKDDSTDLLKEYLLFNDKNNNLVNKHKKYFTKKIVYSKYRAKKNDSLKKIASKSGISFGTILLANNIRSKTILRPGNILIIPNQDGRLITVKKNDSIFKIANRYGIKWEKIVDANNLESSIIIPGMKLFIPGSSMTSYERKMFFGKNYIWPVNGKITSYYGPRIDPFTGAYGFHSGIDIKNKTGSIIKATRDGKVIFIGWQKVYGNFLMIRHDDKTITTYAHLKKINIKKNQHVKQGKCVGWLGSSGRSTGPHLHFEVRKNGKLINPLKILE
ncbi:MAG: M23 family metallopeptidase [Spirochaetes bacterium]|nr:M23 family metallopeptidase [Spirochaetota bacterium]